MSDKDRGRRREEETVQMNEPLRKPTEVCTVPQAAFRPAGFEPTEICQIPSAAQRPVGAAPINASPPPGGSRSSFGVLSLLAAACIGATVATIAMLIIRPAHHGSRPQYEQQSPPSPLGPMVRVDLQGLPTGAVVRLDGEQVMPSSFALPPLPRASSHVIAVSASGRLPFETRFIAERDRSIMVSMQPAPEPTTPEAGVHPLLPHRLQQTPPGEPPDFGGNPYAGQPGRHELHPHAPGGTPPGYITDNPF